MRGEHFIGSVIFAGSIFAAASMAQAATVPLPTGQAAYYLTGEIQNPFWITFDLDAQIQLLPKAEGQNSFYILDLNLSNGSETTAIQFAKIHEGADENGQYGPDGPPRLLFSDAARVLYVDPHATFANALLVSATLYAILPAGLYFTVDIPLAAAEAVVTEEAVTDTPLPGAAPLFATGIGGMGILAWRRLRRQRNLGHPKQTV